MKQRIITALFLAAVAVALLAVGGVVLAMKGAAAEEELKEAKGAIAKLGLSLEKVQQFPVDDTAHNVIVLRKVAPTPAKYPRPYAKIKKTPL